MRLSEAMMLGSTTCRMEASNWNSCALGCAGNAVGIPAAKHVSFVDDFPMEDGRERWNHIYDRWPWLHQRKLLAYSIWRGFDMKVCSGEMTLEQLVDYVRSIEPDCNCNLFGCQCEHSRASISESEVVNAH